MIIDSRYLQAEQIKTDVCIVGAGPAGISMASEFIGQNIEVSIIESGAFEFDASTQKLAAGKTFGDPLLQPIDVNRRQFGGNSNIWIIKIIKKRLGLRYVPFDEIDFEKRDWIPYSGWPFKRSHLEPFYKRAQVVCQANEFAYDPEFWENDQHKQFPLNKNILESGVFQFGPADVFHTHYREKLQAAENIKVYTYANAVEIETDESGKTVDKIRLACLAGKQFSISAKVFILACGGFENARLLLMSNQQQTEGLGNQNDVVGRYYHDHTQAIGNYFIPKDRNLVNRAAFYDLLEVKGTSVQGFLRLSPQILEQERLLNSSTMFFPRPNIRETKAITSFKHLGETLLHIIKESAPTKQLFAQLPSNLLNIVMGMDYITKALYLAKTQRQSILPNSGSGGWSKLTDNSDRFERFELMHLIEQSPHPDNRVKLSKERDALGCQKLQIDWRWRDDDAKSFERSLQLIGKELAKTDMGELQINYNEQGLPKIVRPTGSHHLMGTTRMHNDPKQGVVDSDCKVHGINNLFIAGSSTFPTGGYANPTLTIVAMSLRLADLVSKMLK